ncbi:XRE family transcriptional regulator [Chitinophaga oryziterrae]|uniref:XRE family transcriptional regulator n=1 Tax=Chitinophaga oryziterrae TaxID=1031224 RepID=A0A6N8JHQ6_9BACT|nr:helix-turn-helix transcriptional regulator [Chitinophaga oryziterrae]MVT44835.1 XRE family transcriptional regulator [Chitinophaga oryziterrae]
MLILAQRKKHDLSLRKVAVDLDIDISTLSKVEKGECVASSKMIPMVAQLFELNFKEFQISYHKQTLENAYGCESFFEEANICIGIRKNLIMLWDTTLYNKDYIS